MNTEKNSFKTPEGYFDSFTDNLMTKLSAEETIAPNKDGFKVPEGYFESLYQEIESKLKVEEPKVIQLNPYKKYYFAVASIAAVLLLYFGINFNSTPGLTFDDIANSDIENYFDNNDLDLSSFEIAEVIPVDELEINDIINNHLNDANVVDYLNNSIDDFEELNLDSND